jgi:hypothetical protein
MLSYFQPLQPDLSDFPVHLRPRAMNYIDGENTMVFILSYDSDTEKN